MEFSELLGELMGAVFICSLFLLFLISKECFFFVINFLDEIFEALVSNF